MCKIVTLLASILLFFNFQVIAEDFDVQVVKEFRSIQVDGLLMEWKEHEAKGNEFLTFDGAIVSGRNEFAGYLKLNFLDSNNVSSVKIRSLQGEFVKQIVIDSSFQDIELALDLIKDSSSLNAAILEWQFSLDRIKQSNSNVFNLVIEVLDSKGNVRSMVNMHGARIATDQKSEGNLIVQTIVIIILLSIFIYMKKRARKKFSS